MLIFGDGENDDDRISLLNTCPTKLKSLHSRRGPFNSEVHSLSSRLSVCSCLLLKGNRIFFTEDFQLIKVEGMRQIEN